MAENDDGIGDVQAAVAVGIAAAEGRGRNRGGRVNHTVDNDLRERGTSLAFVQSDNIPLGDGQGQAIEWALQIELDGDPVARGQAR